MNAPEFSALDRVVAYQLLMLASSDAAGQSVMHPAAVGHGQHLLTRAELAECNCPDLCERDHEWD